MTFELAAGFAKSDGKENKMQKLTVCIAALVGFMCGVADCSSAKAKAWDAGQAQVRIVGEGRAASRVEQAGRGVPLRHALEQIVPPDFSINLPNAGPWADVPVSWHARVPFVAALREALAAAPELSADVDLKLRLVTVRASASRGAASDEAAFAMKHVWGLPPNTGNARNVSNASNASDGAGGMAGASVPPSAAMAPTLSAQPPLLAAMQPASGRNESDVKMQAAPAVVPAATARGAAPTSTPTATPIPAPVPASAAASPRAVAGTTAPAAPATTSSTDAIGDPLPAPAPAEPVKQWHLSVSDHTVKTVLTRWSKEDGWQLVWDVPIDFGVDADATVTGTFEQALQAVVDALKKSETPIQAILYRGNKVLRIVAKGAA